MLSYRRETMLQGAL